MRGWPGGNCRPAQVLAADQRVNGWARELRRAGVDGSMDELRALAYLDLLLNRDSRPSQGPRPLAAPDNRTATGRVRPAARTAAVQQAGGRRRGRRRPGRRRSSPGPGPGPGPGGSVIPAGFAGKINLTVPAITLLDLADRPGEIAGIGPVDPDLARDLAAAAAANPKTTWCVTVTDADGHAIGHGCARPEPRNDRGKRGTPGKPGGHDPPGTPGGPDPPGSTSGPRFTFTPDRRDGPPGGCGHLAAGHRDTRAAGPDHQPRAG